MGRGGCRRRAGGPFNHWLNVDCRFLPENPARLTGCISIYTDERDGKGGAAAQDAALSLPPAGVGQIPLFAHQSISLPPIDAVFRFGSPALQAWLRSNGWEPEWGYNDNFQGREAVAEYEAAYQEASPFYGGTAFAQPGGWNMPWPEGDWQEMLAQTLLVWTFQDAEPWVEVWLGEENALRVIQRAT